MAVDGPRGWAVTVAAAVGLTLGPSVLLVAAFGVFVRPLVETFGFAPAQVGTGLTIVAASIMLAAPLQGWLLDRYGARALVLATMPIFAAANLALAAMPARIEFFYLMWFLLPFMGVGLWPVAYLKSVSGWFDRRLGLATGLANAGVGIGTVLVPPLLVAVIANYGVRVGYVAVAALALAAMPVMIWLLHERLGASASERVAADASAWSYRRIIAEPRYRRLVIVFLLIGTTGTSIVGNLVPIMLSKGLTLPQALTAMAAYGGTALLGRLVTGLLLDRWHAFPVAALLCTSTIIALICCALPTPVSVTIGGAALLGLLSGGEFDVLAYVLRRYFGLASFGRMYGLAFSIFQLGGAIGAIILAASLLLSNSYQAGLVVLTLTTIGAIGIFARIGPYPSQGS